jgi:hypothetical protein
MSKRVKARFISLHFTVEDTQDKFYHADYECLVDMEIKSVKNVRTIIPAILRKTTELAVKELNKEVKVKDATYCR